MSSLKWQFCFGKPGLSDGVQEVYSSFLLGLQVYVVNRTQPCLLTYFSALDGLYVLKLPLIGDNSCVCFSNLKRFVYAFRPTLYHWTEITTARKYLAVRGTELSIRTIVLYQNIQFNLLGTHMLTL